MNEIGFGELAARHRAYVGVVDIRVLGAVEIHRDGQQVPLGGPTPRSILALLVANLGQTVSIDRIIDSIYGGQAAAGARRSIQTFISSLRRELGDVIQSRSGGYVLTVEPGSVDSVRFEEGVRCATLSLDTDPEGAAADLREALALWRGHPYANVDGRAVFEPEVARLNELRLAALEARIDADLSSGRHRELIGEIDGLITESPLNERFRVQQMLALYRSGRQTEALRAYERFRSHLIDEVGIEPTKELRRLEQQILDHDPTIDRPSHSLVTTRTVVVVELHALDRPDLARRSMLMARLAEAVAKAVEDNGGSDFVQRGYALYSSFDAVGDALAAVTELATDRVDEDGPAKGIAMDVGEVELHESGELTGPPVIRSAGLVVAAHSGQVLLSKQAHDALTTEGGSGWTLRSLGTHKIQGTDGQQTVFQLVVDGQPADFPPLRVDSWLPPVPVERRSIAGYELRDSLVADLLGVSYRAYQPSVGREVIVSVIDAAWSNSAEFIRRFELEAHLVSQLQHPHIMPILDYWRDPQGAYIVTPVVARARTLSAIDASELTSDQRWAIVAQIGSALSYAHERRLVHGTVSAESVLLDEMGNAFINSASFLSYIVQFPKPSSDGLPSSPSDPISASVSDDVAGLASVARTLAPEPEPSDVPGSVLEGSTNERATDRFESVGHLVAELAQAFRKGAALVSLTETHNPYHGLDAFSETEAHEFFGRSEATAELVDRVLDGRFAAVVGPSGSGKSSLVRAGLIPALRGRTARGEAPGPWVITEMSPGSYPIEEFEVALTRVAVEDPGNVLDELIASDRGLVRVVKRTVPPGNRLLLVIDQFEELFTVSRNREDVELLLTGLTALVRDERSDAHIVVTLRADFFDRPLQHAGFGELLKHGTFPLPALSDPQLAEAIERPAATVGVEWQSGLVGQIVADVAGAPGSLPLLQYALTEVFSQRASDQITLDDYRRSSGVLGTLGIRAEQVFRDLDQRRQPIARQLLLRLTAIQPSGETARRRTPLIELNSLADPSDVSAVLAAFDRARLLTFDRDAVSRGPTVEVAHEALLGNWERLEQWIDEAREDLVLQHRLATAVGEWIGLDRGDDALLAGGRLAQLEEWSARTDLKLTMSEGEYLTSSREHENRVATRRRRRRNLMTAGLGLVAVIATTLALLAVNARRDAAENEDLARARELIATADSVLDDDPELAMLLARRATELTSKDSREARGAASILRRAIISSRVVARLPGGEIATASPDGTLFATLSADGHIAIWDTATQTVAMTLEREGFVPIAAAFGPADRLAVAYKGDGPQVRVWHLDDRSSIDVGTGDRGLYDAHLALASDGSLVAFSLEDLGSGPSMQVWSTTEGTQLYEKAAAVAPAFSADGILSYGHVAEADSNVLIVLADGRSGTVVDQIDTDIDFVPEATSFAPDGSRLLLAVSDIWIVLDVETGQELVRGEADRAIVADWLPDGDRFVIGGEARTEIYDVATGARLATLRGHQGGIGQIAAIPGSELIVTGGLFDQETLLFDSRPGPGAEEWVRQIPVGAIYSASYTPDGERVVIGGSSDYAVVSAQDGTLIQLHEGDRSSDWFPLPNELGTFVAASNPDGSWSVRTTVNGTSIYDAPVGFEVRGVSNDGSSAVIFNPETCEVAFVAPRTRQQSAVLERDCGVLRVFYAPDSSLVAIHSNSDLTATWTIRDPSTGEVVVVPGEETFAVTSEFTTDMSRFVLGGGDGAIHVMDLPALLAGVSSAEATILRIEGHDALILSLNLSDDGTQMVTGAAGEPLRRWDTMTGELLEEIGGDDLPAGIRNRHDGDFHPTEPRLIVTTPFQSIGQHTLEIDELVAIVGERLTRTWRTEECSRYRIVDCPGAGPAG